MRNDCPNEEDMVCFLEDRLPEGERRELERHIEACARCKEIVKLSHMIIAKEQKGELIEQVPEGLMKWVQDMSASHNISGYACFCAMPTLHLKPRNFQRKSLTTMFT